MELLAAFFLLLLASADARIPGVYNGGPWESAHATFYGGSDASGTMGIAKKREYAFLSP